MDKLFGLNGIGGLLLAVVVLLSVVGFLGYNAIATQAANSTNYYKIESQSSIPANVQNAKEYYKDAK